MTSSHSHEQGHDHSHDHGLGGHSHDLRGMSKRGLISALVLVSSYMFVEIVGGILSGSLALIADAGHMLTDAASIGFALVALHFSNLPASAQRTFGYRRLEILAALANALMLWLIAAWVVFEAYHRFLEVPDIEGGLMLAVGSVGLIVNIVAAWILRRSAKHSINVEGAYQHVMADLLGSVGVVVSGVLVWAFGWTLADPILSVVIGILILLSAWRLLGKVIHVLLEGVPEHIDVRHLCNQMEDVEGVVLIHDIHVWSLAPDYDLLTAHILVDPDIRDDELASVRRRLRGIAANDFGIRHITIQLEHSPDGCTEHHQVDPVHARSRMAERRLSLMEIIRRSLRKGRDNNRAQDHHFHEDHEHQHGPGCGHTAVEHDGHTDYLHDGHMHHEHEGHYDDHTLVVSDSNPNACTPDHACDGHESGHQHGPGCGHEAVPHGDHTDYLVGGHLHHPHRGHCDDHGKLSTR